MNDPHDKAMEDARRRFFEEVHVEKAPELGLPQSEKAVAGRHAAERRQRAQPSARDESALPDAWLALLKEVASQPVPPPVVSLYHRLGLTRSRGSKLLGELEQAGLIVLHSLPHGGKGAPLKVPQLTAKAQQQLKACGVTSKAPEGDGPRFRHTLGVLASQLLGERRGFRAQTEVRFPEADVRADLVLTGKQGLRTIVQVGTSDVDREVAAWARLLAVLPRENHRFVMVCLDRTFERGFRKKLQKALPQSQDAELVQMRLIGQLVKECHES